MMAGMDTWFTVLMSQNPFIMKKLLIALIAAAAVIPARAELQTLIDREWAGTFAGFESRSLRFQFLADGSAVVHPLFKDKQVYPYVRIPIRIELEESLADGSTKLHPVLPESLESSDKPTEKLKRSTVKGSFEGGATFEVTLAVKSGAVLFSGKLIDAGTFKDGRARLRIAAEILNFYGKDEKKLKNDPVALAELVAKSSLTYMANDRKRTELDFSESLGSGTVAGVREASVELAVVGPKTFEFEASGASSMRMEPRIGGPLHRGFFVIWIPDADSKAGGEASFSIAVK